MKLQYRGLPDESTDRVLKTVKSGIRTKYRGINYVGVRHSDFDGYKHTTYSEVSNWRCAMQIQRMWFQLYCMGWRNGSDKCLPPLQHWLLSIFLCYREGYSEGSKRRQQKHLEVWYRDNAIR